MNTLKNPPDLGDRIVIEPPGPRVQYLVTIATSRDDLPAKLCDSEFEVREYIAEVERSQDITFEAPDAFPVLPGYLLNLCGRDCPNSVYGFDIWRFEGGAPVRHVVLHGDSGAAERLSSIPAEFFGEGRQRIVDLGLPVLRDWLLLGVLVLLGISVI